MYSTKKTNAYTSSTRFYDIQQNYLTTQLGPAWYANDFQRTGLNRHCKLLLLTFAFEKWGLERVEFRAHTKNARSIAAIKAIGCTEEGILRNHIPLAGGGRKDSIVLSILKTEWENGVKRFISSFRSKGIIGFQISRLFVPSNGGAEEFSY